MYEGLLHVFFFVLLTRHKSIFQRIILPVMVLQESYEIKQVGGVEGTMRKVCEWLQVGVFMVEYKVVRRIAHQQHQLAAVINDGSTVAPRQHCCKQACYFYILLLCKGMWYHHRVFLYKAGLVVNQYFCVQKFFQIVHCLYLENLAQVHKQATGAVDAKRIIERHIAPREFIEPQPDPCTPARRYGLKLIRRYFCK